MNTKSRTIKFLSPALALAALLSLFPVSPGAVAQAQSAQAAGTEVWGQDNCLYVSDGQAWLSAQMCRRFPDARDGRVWDLYLAGGQVIRFDVRTPGWIQLYLHAASLHYAVRNHGSVIGAFLAFKDPNNLFMLGTANTVFNGDNQWHSVASFNQIKQQQLAAIQQAQGQVVLGGQSQRMVTIAGNSGASTASWYTYAETLSPSQRAQWGQVMDQAVAGISSAYGSNLCNLRLQRGDFDASGQKRPGHYDAAGVSRTSPCR